MKLVLLIIASSVILCSNSLNNLSNNSRTLAVLTELEFIEAKNLMLNSNSNWEFNIKYSSDVQLELNSVHSISILYKGSPILSQCESQENFILNCYINEPTQTQYDLIKINYQVTNGATIKWKNLLAVYDIPIMTSLKYEDSFSMKYNNTNNIRNWEFKVKIQEKVLPENGFVEMDLFYSSTKKVVAKCIHNNYLLNCQFSQYKQTPFLIQISPERFQGSIEWENLQNNVTVPLVYKPTNYRRGYNLTFINEQWNYYIFTQGDSIGSAQSLVTLNTKIERGGNQHIYFTKCVTISSSDNTLSCTVIGENQAITDLVYSTKAAPNEAGKEISTDFSALRNEDQIIRNAELTLEKIYDLEYSNSNRLWTFKIEVGTENNLPAGCVVTVDIEKSVSPLICSFQSNILSCQSSVSTLISLQSEKVYGSVTWKNLRQKYTSIPLNFNLKFIKANNAFFTDKWHFIVFVSDGGNAPSQSKIVIDIAQGSTGTETPTPTTASCELIKNNAICVSDLQVQTSNDIIKINPTKNAGSITWVSWTSDSNNEVIKPNLEDTNIFKTANLQFRDAYDMYYSANNNWVFKIHASSSINDIKSLIGMYKVEISVTKSSGNLNRAYAICLLYDGIDTSRFKIRLQCACEYETQEKTDLIKISYSKTDISTVTWTEGITADFPITLNAELTIKKAYNLQKQGTNNNWIFDIDVENDSNLILPLNSKVIVDISETQYLANCTVNEGNKLSCVSNSRGNVEPKLVYLKSPKSSVTWSNTNEEDYYILRTAQLSFLSVDYLYFQDDKWHFSLKVTGINSAKIILDILYNNNPSTATCYGGRNHLINCVVNKDGQSITDLIKLKKEKPSGSESTITWAFLSGDKDIPLKTELSFVKAENLHMDAAKTNWMFDVYITDSDIPPGAFIIVDIRFLYYYGTDERYIKWMNSIANCYHNSKKLTCTAVIERSGDNLYYYGTNLVKTKNPNTISSLIQWIGMSEDILPITLTADLDYFYANKIVQEEGKNIFYIELKTSTKIPKNSPCSVDIKIGSINKISNCVAQNHTTLRCEIDGALTSENVYIAKEKSSQSTIKWNNLEIDQQLFSIELSYVHTYAFSCDISTRCFFRLLVTGSGLQNGLIFPVKIHQIRNYKVGNILFELISYAACKFIDDIFFCTWYNTKGINTDHDLINLMLLGEGDIIKWTNPNNIDIIMRRSHAIFFSEFTYCFYDQLNNYYKYSLKLEKSPTYRDVIYVMDLIFNNKPTYGICTEKKSRTLECFTSVQTDAATNEIFIIKTQSGKRGNIEMRSMTENVQIFPFDFDFAEVDKIYGLQYNANKWEFNIKYSQITTYAGAKNIDIFLGGQEKLGSCSITDTANNILTCTSDTSSELKLITLNEKFISKDHLFLTKTVNNGIPLVSILQFKSVYSLKYQDGWSFTLKAKIPESLTIQIPIGSTFSIDIEYDNDNSDLAFCTETTNANRENNEMILLCVPTNTISRTSLIKLSSETKSVFSSVTWSPSLTEENTIIYLDLDLNVDYVTIPEYDTSTNKWKFDMVFSDDDPLPIGAKIKIDIKYNNEAALATCELIEQKKFQCSPDVSPQASGDSIIISPEKNKGTVSFKNAPEKLYFILALYYLKASSFGLESNKYIFEVDLSKTNMKENGEVNIDILIKEKPSKAKCKHISNNLKCEFDYEGEDELDRIKIKNVKTNNEFRWYDIPDEVLVYDENSITIYGYYYNKGDTDKIFIMDAKETIAETKDSILDVIRQKFLDGEINTIHLNSGNYFFVKYRNVRYIISSSDNNPNDIPPINFGDCLTRLQEGLPINSKLYILYIKVTEPGMIVPKIQYEIYSLSDESGITKLDLEVCKDITVEIETSVDIPEGDLDLYNSSSGFYNDLCYTYTSDKGTDVTIKDRRDDYINKNFAVCEDGCQFNSYDSATSKAKCSCPITLSIASVGNIKIDKERLKENFLDITNVANFGILKCASTFLDDKITENSGFFINTIIIVAEIGGAFVFYFYSYKNFKNQIQNIFDQKLTNKDNANEEQENNEEIKENKKSSIKNIKFENNAPPKKSLIDEENSKNKENSNSNKQNDLKLDINILPKTVDKLEQKTVPQEDQTIKPMNYNDTEMNLLIYKEALDLDKRKYYQYYLSLLRTKHILIFTFFNYTDYNSPIIKIQLFFFTFVLNYTVNGLFFNDSTMNKIYSDGGGFDLSYHLPQIVYSTIIASVINTLVKLIALTEDNVIKIKRAKAKDLKAVYKSETKCMKIKLIVFHVIIFVLLVFCWYYVGCFCSVYKNTQAQLIEDTLCSFVASMIYPFIIDLIPGLFRLSALRDEEQKSNYKYNFSKFIQACI